VLVSANATLILEAMPGFLTTLYAGVPVLIRRGHPGPDPSSPLAGWRPGDPTTCFVVSCSDPEPVDHGLGSFEEIYVAYTVDIVYVKPAAAEPGRWSEDPDIRDKRQTIRDSIYKPRFSPVAGVFNVDYESGPVYEVLDSQQPLIASPMRVTMYTHEPRGF
jgi:hypothetical protein